ncbi:hypothetical protein [Actinophytocola sediminis]
MNRLTTGRRHVRAGSVHVTELINRQVPRTGQPAPASTTSTITLDDLDTQVIDQFEPTTSHRAGPSRGAQLAKLTSLAAATVVLCVAVATATMISHDRAGRSVANRPALRITGDQALLPDQLERTLPPAGAPVPPKLDAPAPSPTPTGSSSTQAAAPTVRPSTASDRAAVASPAEPDPPPPTASMSDVALVESFYDLLPSDPDSAFDLLAPDLLSSTLGEFLDSWSTVRAIDVLEVREHPEGIVAVVRLGLADGGAMRVEQLLTVADSPHRITGAQLLSAQRN